MIKNYSETYNATPILLKPLWFAAGADPVLLRKGTYNDQVKMACLGGTVYATSLLAFFSGTYAIHTVFSEDVNNNISLMSWAMGALWSLIIFNLDRFIVSSTAPNIEDKPNWKKIFSLPFFTRIILGIIIGIVISTPLEIKIFEKDIQKEILAKQPKLMDSLFALKLNENPQYNGMKNDSIKLEVEIKKLKELATDNNNKYREETEGKRTGNIGIGTVAKSYKREEQQAISQAKNYEIELQKLNNNIIVLKDSLKLNTEKDKNVVNSGLNSLVSKASMPHKINPTISLFIVLFLLAIELTPIILKTFMESSPYDYQKNDRDELIKHKSERQKENLIELNKREISEINISHLNKLDQQRKQFDEHLKQEQNSFDEKINLLKSQMDDLLKMKMEKEFAEKFNSLFNEAEQRLYQKNLDSQKEYVYDLDKLEIEESKRKLEKNNQVEDILFSQRIANEERKSLEEIELAKIQSRKKIEEEKLKIHEQEELDKLRNEKNDNSKKSIDSKKTIVDDLIEGKVWKNGENYAYIKILSKDSILEITQDETQAEEWFNSENNKLITDLKLSQYKSNKKNVAEAIEAYNKSTNNSGLNFDLNKAKKLVADLKKVIEESKQG